MDTPRISLTPRLQTLANWVQEESIATPCQTLADVGTDHGYLPLYLLQQKSITNAIASDLNQGPLNRAIALSTQYNIPLDLRLSNGLEKISPHEVDIITIAGMGGMTIATILKAWKKRHSKPWEGRYLLQPMSTFYELRQDLQTLGFTIEKEISICEGDTLYTAMSVVEGKEDSYTKGELWVGKHHPKNPDPLRQHFLSVHIQKLKKTLEKLPPQQTQRREELQERLNDFSFLLQEVMS